MADMYTPIMPLHELCIECSLWGPLVADMYIPINASALNVLFEAHLWLTCTYL